jgi:hypothetical protein
MAGAGWGWLWREGGTGARLGHEKPRAPGDGAVAWSPPDGLDIPSLPAPASWVHLPPRPLVRCAGPGRERTGARRQPAPGESGRGAGRPGLLRPPRARAGASTDRALPPGGRRHALALLVRAHRSVGAVPGAAHDSPARHRSSVAMSATETSLVAAPTGWAGPIAFAKGIRPAIGAAGTSRPLPAGYGGTLGPRAKRGRRRCHPGGVKRIGFAIVPKNDP